MSALEFRSYLATLSSSKRKNFSSYCIQQLGISSKELCNRTYLLDTEFEEPLVNKLDDKNAIPEESRLAPNIALGIDEKNYANNPKKSDKSQFKDPYANVSNQISDEAIENNRSSLYRISMAAAEVVNVYLDVAEVASAIATTASNARQTPQRAIPATNQAPAVMPPAVVTTSRSPYESDPLTTTSSPQQGQSQRHPYRANANSCIGLRGNQLVNNCSKAVYIAFCVSNPRQTKNFFDASDAFKCPNGGLESIPANSANGLIWHGYVHFFACYASEIASMKTIWRSGQPGTFNGLCGGADAPNSSGRYDGGPSLYAD